MSTARKLAPLPVTVTDLPTLRKGGYLYVDKTQHAYNLITSPDRLFFLNRPRRFGKSLFVSTLREILAGNRDLCEGLWISRSDYGWEKHGVIALDFSSLAVNNEKSFNDKLYQALNRIAHEFKCDTSGNASDPAALLQEIVFDLHARFGRVAILIDEYDNPILGMLHNREQAREIIGSMQRFFSTLKSLNAHLTFVFITGISSFAKAGLFSGLNILRITTLKPEYATVCGYTDEEIDTYCRAHIEAWAGSDNTSYAALRERMKAMYNGYLFAAHAPKVYNPFSIMNALRDNKLANFWFESGTPRFLVEELKQRWEKTHDFDMFDPAVNPATCRVTTQELGIFEVGSLPIPALMFQTGYLTVTSYDEAADVYQLAYPNDEVRVSLQRHLLQVFSSLEIGMVGQIASGLKSAFQSQDIKLAVERLEQLFAHIPYQIHPKQEKFYHALLHMACIVAGIRCHSEYSTSHGRIDLVLEFEKLVYVIEIKFKASTQEALDQIEERGYYQRFQGTGKKVMLLGLSFIQDEKKVTIEYKDKLLP